MKFNYGDKVCVIGESFHKGRRGVVQSWRMDNGQLLHIVYEGFYGYTFTVDSCYLRHAYWYEKLFWWFL